MDLRTEPDNPIPDSTNNASCLLAGSEVKIVCENYAFPVGTVMFEKDSNDIVVTEDDPRCVSHNNIISITYIYYLVQLHHMRHVSHHNS